MAKVYAARYNHFMEATTELDRDLVGRLRRAVRLPRLLETANSLIAVPSRTGQGGAVADTLARLLVEDGFVVERPVADHPAAPAVVVWLDTGRPGPTLQFNGHLDTVHLPFVPPGVSEGRLTGSGSCDMKGGVACAVEALRVLRDTGALPGGAVLFTAHDLHEAPWGAGQQLDRLISDGLHGDAVLLPEPLTDHLPMVGRGAATWRVNISRSGPPVHEVMRPLGEPSVIAAGADLIGSLGELHEQLRSRSDPRAGCESVFIGQIHSGEIYNQYPQECWLEGTRRWLPGRERSEVEREFRALTDQLAQQTGTSVATEFRFIRDAFRLDEDDPLVRCFQAAYRTTSGRELPLGPKPFVDDGNSFYGLVNVPAITHGPRAGGQHTVQEWVEIAEMERVAWLYALTAVLYCSQRSIGIRH
jgi:acetylornithine deacetylase/succinyl-diaminopimelate desuccinylase-like protein